MPPKRQRSWHENQGDYPPQSSLPPHEVSNNSESFYRYEESHRREPNPRNVREGSHVPAPPPPPRVSPMVLAQSSDANILSEEELALCSNIEIFAASHSDIPESTYTEQPKGSASFLGQVGLQCLHCARSPLTTEPHSVIFPGSIRDMSASLKIMVDEHFSKCTTTPPELREKITKVNNLKKGNKEEDESEDGLLQFCNNVLPRRAGICDVYPVKSGIKFIHQQESPSTQHYDRWGYNRYNINPEDTQPSYYHHHPPHPESMGRRMSSSSSSTRHVSSRGRMTGPTASSSYYPSSKNSPPIPYQQHHTSPIDNTNEYQHHHYHHHHHHNPPPPPRYDISQAFFRDPSGGWSCRHCYSVPYQYRAPGSVSQSHNPPSSSFIEHHLSMCRGPVPVYHHSTPSAPHPAPPPHPHRSHGPQPHTMWPQTNMFPQTPGHQTVDHPPDPHPPSPPGHTTSSDAATTSAIHYLVSNTLPSTKAPLVLPEDKSLLTDYFYHLMQQLQLCNFSESDRKTRGGKRENVKIGFGGLECKHCANAVGNSMSRKFYWSNVDRLANSFAEIPSHVLKCRNCSPEIKNAIGQLKLKHPEQMTHLPRGSQKVFFRRMWRRMHNEPNTDTAEGNTASNSQPVLRHNNPVPLSIPEDQDWLSDMDCFVRKNLEIFCASEKDIESYEADRKYPILPGQVGIRCLHCAAKGNIHRTVMSFPFAISGIYESVREFQRQHLETCPNIDEGLKEELKGLKTSTSLSSVLRRYYVLAAKVLGLVDSQGGIRASGVSIPIESVSKVINERVDTEDENNDSSKSERVAAAERFEERETSPTNASSKNVEEDEEIHEKEAKKPKIE